ncbi:serine hydrolase domain-containing protein [Pendulispora albinea]|uniref:Beta-lactamase family protein n=1 Tax=Pendulispora albinea TaxID=2741071 RepID=A0ABZ2M7J0_9BACT
MRAFLILLIGICLALGCSSSSSNPLPPPDAGARDGSADALREELDGRMNAAVAKGFSGTVLVTASGNRLLAKGYGLADRAKNVPNTIDTAFDFGSVLKELTAAAIFKLAGEGKLALDDALGTFFKAVPADKAKITVLQLVLHRAGLEAYHDTEGDFEPMTRLEARRRILAQPLKFEPGTQESYSNSGYTLLADIVEIVSTRAYTDYLREQLFVPAKMQQSGFYGDPIWQSVDTAIGYGADTFGRNDPAEWPYSWALVGNGGLVTTVTDLERWLTAVWAGSVLPPPARDAYRTQFLATTAYDFNGKKVYGAAGGGDFGLGGIALDCPEANTRVILATNTLDPERFHVERFARELTDLVLSWK